MKDPYHIYYTDILNSSRKFYNNSYYNKLIWYNDKIIGLLVKIKLGLLWESRS